MNIPSILRLRDLIQSGRRKGNTHALVTETLKHQGLLIVSDQHHADSLSHEHEYLKVSGMEQNKTGNESVVFVDNSVVEILISNLLSAHLRIEKLESVMKLSENLLKEGLGK